MAFLRITGQFLCDYSALYWPSFLYRRLPYSFAFIVHPRGSADIFAFAAFLRHFSPRSVRIIERYLWPTVVRDIRGLRGPAGDEIKGFLISIPMTAAEMLRDRERALLQIRRAVSLARARGARIAGLGGLTASLSRGGEELIDIKGIGITTGHAYTGHIVSETALSLLRKTSLPLDEACVAILGAAGSIGSITAELLASGGVRKFILIDTPAKKERLQSRLRSLTDHCPECSIILGDNLDFLKDAHVVVTATNAPETLVRSHHISPGTFIVDDAQPSDVHRELYDRNDVVVVSGGAVHTPGISLHFPMGLHGDEHSYCCMAEVLALAARKYTSHYVIFRPTHAHVEEIASFARALSFSVAQPQNERGFVADSAIAHTAMLLRKRLQKSERVRVTA